MTFLQAKSELARLANGEYHSIEYQMDVHVTGTQSAQCRVYIHGQKWHAGKTWKQALESMQDAIYPLPPNALEMPGEDKGEES